MIKQFIKALDTDGECFQHIVSAFPKFLFDKIKTGVFDGPQIRTPVRDEEFILFDKIKTGVFDGPQIRTLVHDKEFINKINDQERAAWLSFVAVTQNFFGNKKADNYHVLLTTMLLAYHNLGCKMSIKLHFLHSHLDELPSNPKAISDEQGERFHQDLMTIEQGWAHFLNQGPKLYRF